MSAPEPIDVVRRMYDCLAAVDLDTILEIASPDIEVVQTDELPWGGHFRGHDGLGEFFLKLVGTITSAVTHDDLFAAGDRVVQVGRTAGHVNATGAPFDIREVHVWRVADGRITRFEAYIDTPAMLTALAADGPAG